MGRWGISGKGCVCGRLARRSQDPGQMAGGGAGADAGDGFGEGDGRHMPGLKGTKTGKRRIGFEPSALLGGRVGRGVDQQDQVWIPGEHGFPRHRRPAAGRVVEGVACTGTGEQAGEQAEQDVL